MPLASGRGPWEPPPRWVSKSQAPSPPWRLLRGQFGLDLSVSIRSFLQADDPHPLSKGSNTAPNPPSYREPSSADKQEPPRETPNSALGDICKCLGVLRGENGPIVPPVQCTDGEKKVTRRVRKAGETMLSRHFALSCLITGSCSTLFQPHGL